MKQDDTNVTIMAEDTKLTLYLDVDDTVLQSSVRIVEMLNKKYNIQPPKTVVNLKGHGYTSIYPCMQNEIDDMYASDEFFAGVKFFEGFLKFYEENKEVYDFTFVTFGSEGNLSKKEDFLRKYLGEDITIHKLPFNKGEGRKYDKSVVDMTDGIQIDDSVDCMADTNAATKILFRSVERPWNENYTNYAMYVVDNWFDAIDIIEFMNTHRDLMEQPE